MLSSQEMLMMVRIKGKIHLSAAWSAVRKLPLFLPSSFLEGKIFQNLSVSSPAPVTMVVPSGLMAR